MKRMPEPEFVTIPDLLKRWHIGRTKLYTLQKDPSFPKPLVLGTQTRRWWLSDIVAYEQSLASMPGAA